MCPLDVFLFFVFPPSATVVNCLLCPSHGTSHRTSKLPSIIDNLRGKVRARTERGNGKGCPSFILYFLRSSVIPSSPSSQIIALQEECHLTDAEKRVFTYVLLLYHQGHALCTTAEVYSRVLLLVSLCLLYFGRALYTKEESFSETTLILHETEHQVSARVYG